MSSIYIQLQRKPSFRKKLIEMTVFY